MPAVLQVDGYRFFFYSDERNEPPHVHVEAADRRAKFWLVPIALSWNDGFRSGEVKAIEQILRAHGQRLVGEWNEHFGI